MLVRTGNGFLRTAIVVKPSLILPRISTSTFATQHGSTASSSQSVKQDVHSTLEAIVSRSSNPWFNLAFEDHLFRTKDPASPVLFLYRNSPCVVVGRNQNPWSELNAAVMRSIDLPLVRRRSGGGTVYHDLGNTNYSFHIPREDFDRRTHAELVARALNSPPTSLTSSTSTLANTTRGAYVNNRNDICIRVSANFDSKSTKRTLEEIDELGYEERKVSGSAYKLVNMRAYHHGTMLLSASLGSLGSSLHNNRGESLVTKGVASFPSPVANLVEAFPDRKDFLTHEAFVEAVVREFYRTYQAASNDQTEMVQVDESWLDREELNQGRWKLRENFEELQSWDWVFGQTPEFTHTLELKGTLPAEDPEHAFGSFYIEIHSKNGIILEAQLRDAKLSSTAIEKEVMEWVEGLKDRRYDDLATAPPWGPQSKAHSEQQKQPPSPSSSLQSHLYKLLRNVL